MSTAMTTRERFHAVLDGQAFDRLPVLEWAGWWNQTIDRWHGEGLPRDCVDRYDICRHFDLDVYVQDWARGIHWDCPYQPPHHGAGILAAAGGDLAAIEPYLGRWPVMRERIEPHVAAHERGDCVFWFSIDGFFWLPRVIFGIEDHLYAFYDEPELMHRINQIQADWACRYIDELCTVIQPDFMTFAEDMSYNHGPMISRELWDTFIAPYYRQVVPKLREHGIRVFIDSDGDISSAAPWFLEAGIEGVLPLERQAGVDVAQLRRDHPELRLLGAFDKLTMHRGEAAMRAEFERLLPTARQGGLLISCDHQTPPAVSYSDYQLYLQLFREYAAKAGSLTAC